MSYNGLNPWNYFFFPDERSALFLIIKKYLLWLYRTVDTKIHFQLIWVELQILHQVHTETGLEL